MLSKFARTCHNRQRAATYTTASAFQGSERAKYALNTKPEANLPTVYYLLFFKLHTQNKAVLPTEAYRPQVFSLAAMDRRNGRRESNHSAVCHVRTKYLVLQICSGMSLGRGAEVRPERPLVLLSTARPTSPASDQTKGGGSVGCTENTRGSVPRAKDSI